MRKGSMLHKIILLYLCSAFIPIVMISIITSRFYYTGILQKTDEMLEQKANQHEIIVQERISNYQSTFYELITETSFIRCAEAINSDGQENLSMNREEMSGRLESAAYSYDDIRGTVFLANNGIFVPYSKWYSSMEQMTLSDESFRKEILADSDQYNELTYIGTVNLNKYKNQNDFVILMVLNVRNLHTKEICGVLIMAIEDEALLFDDGADESVEAGITTVILDDEDKVIAVKDKNYTNKSRSYLVQNRFSESQNVSQKNHDINRTNWSIAYIYDTSIFTGDIYQALTMILVVTAAITLIFFAIMFMIGRRYIAEVLGIANSIAGFKGPGGADDVEVAEPLFNMDESDELYIIVHRFNEMKGRINSLIETLKRRNEEVRQAALNQKNAELKALEAQINPHFLYNTLDSINWRAIEHEEEEISDMLSALGSLLRYSVSNIDKEVILNAELSWIEKYIFLQRERFNYSFDCEYEVTEEAGNFVIYKMLLQPLVENTIMHAFVDTKEGGIILVKAYVRQDGMLEIRVRDNGTGIPREKLNELKRNVAEAKTINTQSIGIYNVLHRLRIYYHDKAELIIDSEEGEGTVVVMIIPDLSGENRRIEV